LQLIASGSRNIVLVLACSFLTAAKRLAPENLDVRYDERRRKMPRHRDESRRAPTITAWRRFRSRADQHGADGDLLTVIPHSSLASSHELVARGRHPEPHPLGRAHTIRARPHPPVTRPGDRFREFDGWRSLSPRVPSWVAKSRRSSQQELLQRPCLRAHHRSSG